jgi:hypothetical protein
MATPTYTTDLQTFFLFESAFSSLEFTNYTAGRTQSLDTDFPIQGTSHGSAILAVVGMGSIAVDYGSNITWTSGWNFFMWGVFLAAAAVDTRANGGVALIIGADTANHRAYYVGGNDFGSYPEGGWQNFVADPEVTPDVTTGTPGTTYRYCGIGCKAITAVAKGSPQGMDATRFGRGEFRVNGGETANYATFAGMALANDDINAKWGLFKKIEGGYKFKGLMNLGYGSLVDFRDANVSIVIDNTLFVKPTFNRIEINTIGSNIELNTVNITALGTVSRGDFVVVVNVVVAKTSCAFTDMGFFTYQSNSTLLSTIYRRCGLVTQGGATFTGCIFDKTFDTEKAILSDNPSLVTYCDFTSSGTKHAVRCDTIGTYAWTGNTDTGYTGTRGSNLVESSGSADAMFYNNSGGLITLNVGGGGQSPSVRNGIGATTAVVQSVTLTLTGLIAGTEIRILSTGTTTELDGVESSSTTFAFAYKGADVGNGIDIVIHNIEYEYLRIINYILGANDSSIPISQRFDRNYNNPI